jgi:hypothetical protein
MNTHTQVKLTDSQLQSVQRLIERGWDVTIGGYALGEGKAGIGCVMVKCISTFNGNELWYGIEPDGYTHS